jgi:hypothetical protein
MTQTAAAAATTDRFGVPLKGWSFAPSLPEVDEIAVIVACEMCGDTFSTEDPDDDTLCCACSMPPAELAALRMVPAPARPACLFCGDPMYGTDSDGTRHPRCARFLAGLDARRDTRKDQPIAA